MHGKTRTDLNFPLQYIHFNPVKAGMGRQCIDYMWSSARELSGIRTEFQTDGIAMITHRHVVWRRISADEIRDLLYKPCTSQCLEDEVPPLTDEEIWRIVEKATGISNTQQLSQAEHEVKKQAALACLRHDINKFRIVRTLGLYKNFVYRM